MCVSVFGCSVCVFMCACIYASLMHVCVCMCACGHARICHVSAKVDEMVQLVELY